MKKTEIDLVPQERIKAVFCNKCTREVNLNKESYFEGMCKWGYESRRDGQIHEFHLCEDCYEELIKSFRIDVDIEAYF